MTRDVLKQQTVITEQLLNDLISLYQTAVLLEGKEQWEFIRSHGLTGGICGAAAGLGLDVSLYCDPYFKSFAPVGIDSSYWYPTWGNVNIVTDRNRLCLRPRLRKLKAILKDYTNERSS